MVNIYLEDMSSLHAVKLLSWMYNKLLVAIYDLKKNLIYILQMNNK